MELRARDLPRAQERGDIYRGGPAGAWRCSVHSSELVRDGLNLKCPSSHCFLLVFSPPKVPA